MDKPLFLVLLGLSVLAPCGASFGATFVDLSKSSNMGLEESFDEAVAGIPDLKEKNGLRDLPTGNQTFRGVPFQILDPDKNQGKSFVVLKGRNKPDFPVGISIPLGHLKAPFLYFLHSCRWGGTASNITVAEYDIVYDDGQVAVIPLRVGVEFTNFFNPRDTDVSYLAWWHKYKNTEMGINLFPWKNPRPDAPIQSILFKSRDKMPVPILFAITASDQELAVSPDSPKPEKTFQTDTSKWIPFEPSGTSSAGTAIDMSFLLDAPAGKHGKVKADGDKLVFEDGTPARFWGVSLTELGPTLTPDSNRNLADRLAAFGCNAVLTGGNPGSGLVKTLNEKGIYVFTEKPLETPVPESTATPEEAQPEEPAAVDQSILNLEKATWPPNLGITPIRFKDLPMTTLPEESLPIQFAGARTLGKTFTAEWGAGWPNEYLGELPLLLSAYADFEGWNASFGLEGGNSVDGPMERNENLFGEPQILAQWPTSSLAFLRGDLKEGRVYVLEKVGAGLKALAHKSGVNPDGGGTFKTDRSGELKAKVNEKTKSFISDTGQIDWQGNVGVVKVDAPRFQALIGFLAHRKFNNAYWAVDTPNLFASISAISLNKKPINTSDHLLLTGVTRMENTGQVYNASKTKLMDPGKAPILREPLAAKIVLYRFVKDPKIKIRALDASGHPLKIGVPTKWIRNNLIFSWVPQAIYLEIYK